MSYKGCDSPPQVSIQTDSWESLSEAITGKFLALWHWQHSPISTLNSSSNRWVRFYHSCVNASKYLKHRLSHQTWVPCKWSGFAQSFVPWKATDSETWEQYPTPASPPASAAQCHELIHCLSEKEPLVQPFFSFSLMVFPPPTCHLHLPENDILDCANWQSITFCLNYWAFPLWNTDVKVTLRWFRTNNQNSPLFSETKTPGNGLIIKCPWNVLSSPRRI